MVRSTRNQYWGINAHLHSLFQAEGGWSGFYTVHIGDLFKTLSAALLPMGYVAGIEDSLQIRRVGESPRQPRADVTIYNPDPAGRFAAASAQPQTIALLDLLSDEELSEKPYRALVIYELDDNRPGKPVAWIELLSPSNKGESADAELYRAKRMNIMVSGLVFVEIDYLHESPPTFSTIANYAAERRPSDAHPYRIIVIDPRPHFEAGRAQVIGFDVDEPLPSVDIPLNGGDALTFDFGVPYRKTFEEGLYGRLVDYKQLPQHFDRYSLPDQTRIVRRMLAVVGASGVGADLEAGKIAAVPDVTLDEALERLAALR